MKRVLILVGGVAVLGAAMFAGFGTASGADHADAPLSKANHQLDLADVYAFRGSPGNVVLAMTINPLSMPGEAPTFLDNPDGKGLYQFKIDNNGDAVADISFNVTFGTPDADGSQSVVVRKATGDQANTLSNGGTVYLEGASTSPSNGTPKVFSAFNNAKLFAGLRDDPFFFDLNAFKAGLKFRNPGTNFFAGLNVSAIVIQVAESEIMQTLGNAATPDTTAGVWAVTSKDGAVIDRMGRPAINTVFIPADQKDNFNNTKPQDDLKEWKSTVVSKLQSLGSDPALADALLPDILTFDTSAPFGFLNGRQLSDDVIDGELALITGNSAASDYVSNDSEFLSVFPYLGRPNTEAAPAAPEPTTAPPPPPAPTKVGVKPPDTGTGDGTNGGNGGVTLLVSLLLGGAVVLTAGGAMAARGRSK